MSTAQAAPSLARPHDPPDVDRRLGGHPRARGRTLAVRTARVPQGVDALAVISHRGFGGVLIV